MTYAQIDDNNVCIAMTNLNEAVSKSNMILVTDGKDHLGQKYNDGVWEDVIPDVPSNMLSDVENAIYEMQVDIAYMAIMSEMEEG